MAQTNENGIVVDVREPDEFRAESVPGSINVPLSNFNRVAPVAVPWSKTSEVIFMCRSGQRARLAVIEAQRMGLVPIEKCRVYPGGIIAWKKDGGAVDAASKTSRLPMLRQVQLIVGYLVLASSIGVLSGFPGFAYVSAVLGAGLTVAGLSGFCGLALLLSKLPWNKGETTSCLLPEGNK